MEQTNNAFTNWIIKNTHATTHPSDQERYHAFIRAAAKSDEYVDSEWLEEKLNTTPNNLTSEQIKKMLSTFDTLVSYAKYAEKQH